MGRNPGFADMIEDLKQIRMKQRLPTRYRNDHSVEPLGRINKRTPFIHGKSSGCFRGLCAPLITAHPAAKIALLYYPEKQEVQSSRRLSSPPGRPQVQEIYHVPQHYRSLL